MVQYYNFSDLSMNKIKESLHDFIKLCLATKDAQALTELFDLFLTLEEKESLALRYKIVKEMVKQEKPQRQIAEDIGVSIAKITRASNALKVISPKLANFLREKMR